MEIASYGVDQSCCSTAVRPQTDFQELDEDEENSGSEKDAKELISGEAVGEAEPCIDCVDLSLLRSSYYNSH